MRAILYRICLAWKASGRCRISRRCGTKGSQYCSGTWSPHFWMALVTNARLLSDASSLRMKGICWTASWLPNRMPMRKHSTAFSR